MATSPPPELFDTLKEVVASGSSKKILIISPRFSGKSRLISRLVRYINRDMPEDAEGNIIISVDNDEAQTSRIKELVSYNMRCSITRGMRRHLSILDIDKWNLNLQNWLYDTVRTFDEYVFLTASDIHAVHANILSHFLVLRLPLEDTLVRRTLGRVPADVSGRFWGN